MTADELHAWAKTAERGDSVTYYVGYLALHAGDVAREVMRLAAAGLVAPVQRATGDQDKPRAYEAQRTRRPWASHLVGRR